MKITEVVDWKGKTEEEQLAAVKQDGRAIRYIDNPSMEVIKIALTNQTLIDDVYTYNNQVKRLFANNALLMNKWLRYGENMRSS